MKLFVIFFAILLSLTGLTGYLIYIEHTAGDRYQRIVLAQQVYDSVSIPYRRGDITDCKGSVLATSVDVYNVILDCYVLTSEKDYLEPTLEALLSTFPELDAEEVRAYIRDNPDSRYRVLAKHVPYEEMQRFTELQNGAGSKGKESEEASGDEESDDKSSGDKKTDTSDLIRGVWFEKEYIRNYPYKSLASSVIGFTTSGDVGMSGLENYYSDVLNGTNGRQYGYLNSENAVEKSVKEALNGHTVVTTLDMNIQSVVEAKIAEFDKAYANEAREGPGAERIGVIILDPNTGAVLSMANFPDFDLSDPRSLENYYTQEEIDAMSEEEEMEKLQQLWRNFCISDTFEPGSTQKPLTVAAGLDCGALSGNEYFDCNGYEKVGDKQINCVATGGHGPESIQGALMDSCNDALMQMVRMIGKENFCNYQSIFGMGLRTNIDLPGEARTDSLVRLVENTSAVDLATESFGQNYNCTMIQMICAFASVINGGDYYQPYLVSRIEDENGNTVEEIRPRLLKQTVSKETSDKVKEYLYATVSDGTANVAKVSGYSMGGKTGTAEKLPRKDGNYLVSFIGYLPEEHPQLVIYTVIDTPNQSTAGQKQAHSTFAQNLTREILEEILPYMNIYKDEKVDKDAPKNKDTNMYTAIEGYEARANLGEAVTYE